MKSWILTILTLLGSWHFMSISSESRFESVFLPLVFFVGLVVFVLKLAWKIGPNTSRPGCGGDGMDFFDGGGDSGC